jgi:hypothetical protein
MRSLHPWPLFPTNLEPPAARSLSLQFVLQEWVGCAQVLESIVKKTRDTVRGTNPLPDISKELEKFFLFSLDNPFTQKGGTLDKLCYYCDALFQVSKAVGHELIADLLEHMRNTMLKIRSKLLIWKRTMPPLEEVSAEIERHVQELFRRLQEFFEALFPYLEEARSDENVLFFLIEKKEIMNRFLYPQKVEHALARLYPSGPAHLRAILCEGYTRRGFSEFYAQHESLIDSIDWVTDEWETTTATH